MSSVLGKFSQPGWTANLGGGGIDVEVVRDLRVVGERVEVYFVEKVEEGLVGIDVEIPSSFSSEEFVGLISGGVLTLGCHGAWLAKTDRKVMTRVSREMMVAITMMSLRELEGRREVYL